MNTPEIAVETKGVIDKSRHLIVKDPLPMGGPVTVRVIVLLPEDNPAAEEREWIRSAVGNPAFDFLRDDKEDIYSPEDGRPFHDEG